jgi:hypothetical protein
MPWLTRSGKAYLVPAGTLDDGPGEAPSRNVHWASRSSWYAPVGELPTFADEPR